MTRWNVGRILMVMGVAILAALFSFQAFAQDISIINIRKNVPLSDTEKVYRDYYLNAGSEAGLKKNQVVTVIRKVAVRDATGTQNIGDLTVPVGQLKIISAQNRVSVAREIKLISREDEPLLEQLGLMTGDRIELSSAVVDKK